MCDSLTTILKRFINLYRMILQTVSQRKIAYNDIASFYQM